MADFTSALYLGLWLPSRSLRPWDRLTSGRPAALDDPAGARETTRALAILQGCERATLGASTLHLFWDLFGMLAGSGFTIHLDDGAYPIAQWGVERAAAHGARVRSFPHHDADALRLRLHHDARCSARSTVPIIVADGWCPGCGKPAPIVEYLDIARTHGGYLILDDTQALGILGHSPEPDAPMGRGGGGSLRRCGIHETHRIVVISSLAKGFGVPVAVLAGSRSMVDRFEARSETRVHCSPPSIAAVRAAEHALRINTECGDALRLRLAGLVRDFRSRLAATGFSVTGGLFPVQTLVPVPRFDAAILHKQLLRAGVRAVLQGDTAGTGARITFLINARHQPGEIAGAVDALARVAGKRA